MATRLPASERTREELQALIDGRLGSSDERSALLRLATRLIVEEALKAEVEDALGRGYYEHGAAAGAGYRNVRQAWRAAPWMALATGRRKPTGK
jgi:hypothetical protein